ncbi:hypothetical protein MNBD_GAMMA16-281 [hydrothermal vent metagenome]|uniref:DUF3581 domain-containing protein n=1 Tax=hydrothermal vent metagenome TaxID=652676 RepID=A0A3B1A0T9_9ZZZZ
MNINNYYSNDGDVIRFSRAQSSTFAKDVANDFNPIHDTDAKRFCVPGDLLFALVLTQYGLSEKMNFTFAGMVNDTTNLKFSTSDNTIKLADQNDKLYLAAEHQGANSTDTVLITSFIQSYVEFSGHNFPHILVPLMAEHGVMINPDRPLVMYQGMSFELYSLDLKMPKLELVDTYLEVIKKRGNVTLSFNLTEDGKLVGQGEKKMILSNLRSYEKDKVDGMIDLYASFKSKATA